LSPVALKGRSSLSNEFRPLGRKRPFRMDAGMINARQRACKVDARSARTSALELVKRKE